MASLSHLISGSPPMTTPLRLPFLFRPAVISPKPIAFTARGLVSFGSYSRRNVRGGLGLGFACNAVENEEWMGESSMPDGLKHLTKEVPGRPNKWLLISGLALLLYTWRAILWELSKYASVLLSLANIILDPIKLLLKIPIFLISSIYTFSLYTFQTISFFTPVPELSRVIFFSSIVLSIGGAASSDSINAQKQSISLAGIVSFLTISGYVPEVLFWVSLSSLFCYSFFVKKSDVVSAGLSPATALAAIGEPWLRFLVIVLYLAIAIKQYSKYTEVEREREKEKGKVVNAPLPLQVAALSIGISVAATWARHRHLLWMAAS